MKAFIIAAITATVLASSMPAFAHQHCGWQWPGDDANANTVRPTFSSTDCMASHLNREALTSPTGNIPEMPAR